MLTNKVCLLFAVSVTLFVFPVPRASAQAINVQGRASLSDGSPMLSSTAEIRIQVVTPDSDKCILFDETRPLDLSATGGHFSFNLNGSGGTRNAPFTYSFEEALSNRSPKVISGTYCSSGSGTITYIPSPTDNRRASISLRESSTSPWETFGEVELNPAPFSIESRAVGGFSVDSLVRVANSGTPAPAPVFDSVQASELLNLASGSSALYMSSSNSSPGGAKLPSYSTPPSAPTAGSIWFDSSLNSLMLYDGSGTINLSAGGGGGGTVAVTAPVVNLGSSANPNIGMYSATGSRNGYLTSSDWTAFNSKLSASLSAAQIWVGNAGNIATAVSPSGDVSLSNTGSFSVTGIRGQAVSGQASSIGQIIRYQGSNTWTPGFVTMGDLRSTVTGASAISGGCTSSQTLTWMSGTDNLQCQNIGGLNAGGVFSAGTVVPVANGGTGEHTVGQGLVFAGPASGSGAPSFRAIAAADLPASASYWAAATGGIAYSGRRVGIGTTSPSATLHVVSTATTGTISSVGADVSGVGTNFNTSLQVGDRIVVGSEIKTVLFIASATSLTVNSAFITDLPAGTSYSKVGTFLDAGALRVGNSSQNLLINTNADLSGVPVSTNTLDGVAFQGAQNSNLVFDLRNNDFLDAFAIRYSSTNSTLVDKVGFVMKGSGRVGIGTINPSVSLDVGAKTDALALPRGSTAEQPSAPSPGMIRWNTSAPAGLEVYTGTTWDQLTIGGSGSYLSATGGTLSGALTVASGGASINGGLNNNSGGISSAGSITGVGANITGASALTIAAGGSNQNLTLNSTGSGSVNLGSAGATSLSVNAGPVGAVNYVTVTAAASGGSPGIGTEGSDAHINLAISPKGAGSSIFTNGNVGIGTTAPSNKLEVVHSSTNRVYSTTSGSGAYTDLAIESGTTNGQRSNLIFAHGTSSAAYVGTDHNGTAVNALTMRTLNATPITFRPNSVEVLRVAANGTVGIGTDVPLAPLHAYTTAATGTISSVGTAVTGVGTNFTAAFKAGDTIIGGGLHAVIDTISSDTALTLVAPFSSDLTSALVSKRIAVFENGNVAIGTTTAGTLLTMRAADSKVYVPSSTTQDNPFAGSKTPMLSIGNTDTTQGTGAAIALSARSGSRNTTTYIGSVSSPSNYRADFFIGQRTGNSSYAERFRIANDGSVGIGTTAPLGLLDSSSGDLSLVIGADTGARTRTDATTKTSRFGSAHYTNTERPAAITLMDSTATANSLKVGGGTIQMNAATEINFYTAATNTTAGGSRAMLIDSSANVAIGGLSAATSKLDVSQTTAGGVAIQAGSGGTNKYFKVVAPVAGLGSAWNTADAIMFVGRDTGTNRSINAAGTINASGADFAEWILWRGVKPEPGTIIEHQGTLVVVSSPDTAAFIGNDVLSPTDAVLVAFSGQVPVLVRGAVTQGDLLLREADGVARAVKREMLTADDSGRVVGIAWASDHRSELKRVGAAVGLTSINSIVTKAAVESSRRELKRELAAGRAELMRKSEEIEALRHRLETLEKIVLKDHLRGTNRQK